MSGRAPLVDALGDVLRLEKNLSKVAAVNHLSLLGPGNTEGKRLSSVYTQFPEPAKILLQDATPAQISIPPAMEVTLTRTCAQRLST